MGKVERYGKHLRVVAELRDDPVTWPIVEARIKAELVDQAKAAGYVPVGEVEVDFQPLYAPADYGQPGVDLMVQPFGPLRAYGVALTVSVVTRSAG